MPASCCRFEVDHAAEPKYTTSAAIHPCFGGRGAQGRAGRPYRADRAYGRMPKAGKSSVIVPRDNPNFADLRASPLSVLEFHSTKHDPSSSWSGTMNQVRAGNPSQYFVNAIGVLRRAAAALAPLAEARTGVAAVEFAMVAPLLLGMLVPVVDLGMAYSQRIQVQLAAEAGAQYAASHPWNTNSATTIANAVRAATPLSGVAATPAPNQTCGCPNGSIIAMASCGSKCANGQTAGYYVVVNAQLPYTPKLPYSVLGRSTMLTAQATVRIR